MRLSSSYVSYYYYLTLVISIEFVFFSIFKLLLQAAISSCVIKQRYIIFLKKWHISSVLTYWYGSLITSFTSLSVVSWWKVFIRCCIIWNIIPTVININIIYMTVISIINYYFIFIRYIFLVHFPNVRSIQLRLYRR